MLWIDAKMVLLFFKADLFNSAEILAIDTIGQRLFTPLSANLHLWIIHMGPQAIKILKSCTYLNYITLAVDLHQLERMIHFFISIKHCCDNGKVPLGKVPKNIYILKVNLY